LFALKVEKVNGNTYEDIMKEVEQNRIGFGLLLGKYEHFD